MTRKQRRMLTIAGAMSLLTIAAGLVLFAMRDTLVFFYTPSELTEKQLPPGKNFRIGGLVQQGSVVRDADGVSVSFIVTDLTATLPVRYRGLLPDLFREGQGVVAEGAINSDGIFIATQVLAKHDENYMPPEVAEALKKSGKWKGETP